jgi:hypothetical protein
VRARVTLRPLHTGGKIIVPNVIPKPSWSVVIMAEKMRVVPDIMLPVASSVIDMVIESPSR